MEGNPLEKQLSKQGTISLNSLKAHIAKGNAMEKEVMNAALQQFKGQDKIDYNDFRKAVQDRLIRYKRTPDTRFEDYGADRLAIKNNLYDVGDKILSDLSKKGYDVEDSVDYDGLITHFITDKTSGKEYVFSDYGDILNFAKVHTPDIYNRYINDYDRIKFNTFTFSSNKIPNGSGKHFFKNTLGHSRTFILPEEPDVLHVMESQSDWAQQQIGKFTMPLDDFKTNPKTNQPFTPEELSEFRSVMAQRNYLTDNYLQRQLQENLLYAAENGLKKMRYPTPETAATIEGYKKDMPIENSALDFWVQRRVDLNNELTNKNIQFQKARSNGNYLEYRVLGGELKDLLDFIDECDQKIDELKLDPSQVEYPKEYMTILKKYADFPKMYEKLYGKGTVRTVTDDNGNTWYEVDVPDNFLQREWQYKRGGKLKYYNK